MIIAVVSNPSNFHGEADAVLALFREGLEYFHLRKPDMNAEQTSEWLNNIPGEFHHRIIIHRHYSLLSRFGLKGIHVPFDLIGQFSDDVKGHISVSCHNTGELFSIDSKTEYAFLSPVFDSISKPDYKSAFDLASLKTFFNRNRLKTKVLALGGIDNTGAVKAIHAGFDGIALLGYIWKECLRSGKAGSAVQHYSNILNAIENSINIILR
ncbi:MAG: thiamine phosphate synthase [Bacteroidetes bacterium]|nr:thiamine phosphate synthase [Bacteroidota bacterium]